MTPNMLKTGFIDSLNHQRNSQRHFSFSLDKKSPIESFKLLVTSKKLMLVWKTTLIL